VLFQNSIALNKRIPVFVCDIKRITLQEVHVNGLAKHARHVNTANAPQLVFTELQQRIICLEPESIAELPVPELLGNNTCFFLNKE
jgi:hypothetical protein